MCYIFDMSCGDQIHTVVILHFNKLRLTFRCIESVLSAGYSPKTVYCFDNGSQTEFFHALTKQFPDIHQERIEKNRGYSGGFNAALRWVFSTGKEAALFLTNDTVLYPKAVELCSETAAKTDSGLVAPCVTYLKQPDLIDSSGAYFDINQCNLNHYREYGLQTQMTGQTDYIPGTAIWISSSAFEKLNGVDESYHTYWEDVDMCFRARKEGIKMARCYNARVGHGVGQTCHKKPIYTAYYYHRNRIRFCRKQLSSKEWNRAKIHIRNDLDSLAAKWRTNRDEKRLEYYFKLIHVLAETTSNT